MAVTSNLSIVGGGGEVYRIISTRYPQISIFERVADAQSFNVLYEIEALTNNRLRDEVGEIALVPPNDRVYGPGSSWIMAPFTHPPVDGSGGRFNKDFGMFYCAEKEHIAIAETMYHTAKFLRESRIESITVEMRVLRAQLGYQDLHDATAVKDASIYDLADYRAGQILGAELKGQGAYGIKYRSVRGKGNCVGIFRPIAVAAITHSRYLHYDYKDGEIASVKAAEAKL